MRKAIKISLLAILLGELCSCAWHPCCAKYKRAEVMIDGKERMVKITSNYFADIDGIRPFENNPEGKYDGLLFMVNPKTAFTMKGVKHHLLICSLEKVNTGFKTLYCKCLAPGVAKYYPRASYVYEELVKDKNCTQKIKF